MKQTLGLLALLLLSSVAVFSDIARPDKTPTRTPKPKTISSSMTIRMDSNTKVATLRVPKDKLKQLSAELDQLADESDDTAAVNTPGLTRTQTIVSGIFLSLALVFGGMWFARSGRSSTTTVKTLVIFALIAGAGSAATFVYGNVGPPQALRSISSELFDRKAFLFYSSAGGTVNIEVTNGSSVELSVPAPKNWPKDKEETKPEE